LKNSLYQAEIFTRTWENRWAISFEEMLKVLVKVLSAQASTTTWQQTKQRLFDSKVWMRFLLFHFLFSFISLLTTWLCLKKQIQARQSFFLQLKKKKYLLIPKFDSNFPLRKKKASSPKRQSQKNWNEILKLHAIRERRAPHIQWSISHISNHSISGKSFSGNCQSANLVPAQTC